MKHHAPVTQHEAPMKHHAPVAHKIQHASPVKYMTADAAEGAASPAADQSGKVNSEQFTKGRFDSSETLVQNHHSKHHKMHHRPSHVQHQSLASKEMSEKEMEETYMKDEAAAKEISRIKALQ